MSFLAFITHPEVDIQPETPVHQWKLSQVGRHRAASLLKQPWITEIQSVFSSDEKKAAETAQVLSEGLSLSFQTNPKLGEIDRSSTGYLPELEHSRQVQEWFNHPEASIKGWERGVDAQDRVVRATTDVISLNPNQNIAIISHGGVGALLMAHYKNMPIHSRHSPEKLGSFFIYDIDAKRIIRDWHPIDLQQHF